MFIAINRVLPALSHKKAFVRFEILDKRSSIHCPPQGYGVRLRLGTNVRRNHDHLEGAVYAAIYIHTPLIRR
jgi:hypothetical protein